MPVRREALSGHDECMTEPTSTVQASTGSPEVDALSQDALDATAAMFPTLTVDEVREFASSQAAEAALDARIEALVTERTAHRKAMKKILDRAALRDVTPEEVALTYRTTGRGERDLAAVLREMHPYIRDVARYGTQHGPMVCAAGLSLYGDDNDPAQIPSLAAALASAASLLAPEAGLSFEIDVNDGRRNLDIDWQWHQHANGLHPVAISEDDLGATRSFVLAHSADGDRAVLLDRRRSWRYGADGVVATGTLIEVLAALFHQVREVRATSEDDGY